MTGRSRSISSNPLQKSGVKIARVSFENGRFDIITADDPNAKVTTETSDDVKKLL